MMIFLERKYYFGLCWNLRLVVIIELYYLEGFWYAKSQNWKNKLLKKEKKRKEKKTW
jgi:hypothetical protein